MPTEPLNDTTTDAGRRHHAPWGWEVGGLVAAFALVSATVGVTLGITRDADAKTATALTPRDECFEVVTKNAIHDVQHTVSS